MFLEGHPVGKLNLVLDEGHLPQAIPAGPGGSAPPGSSFSGDHGWSLLMLLLRGPLAAPGWLQEPYQKLLWWGL